VEFCCERLPVTPLMPTRQPLLDDTQEKLRKSARRR